MADFLSLYGHNIGSTSGGDVIKDTMSLEDYQDAQNLDEGIYPISTDDSTVITADMVDYDGTNTVSDTLDAITNVSFHKYTIAGNIPTTAEMASAVASINEYGSVVITFYNAANWCASTFYGNLVGNQYGAGILVSYYSSKFYKVTIVGGSATLTAF